MLPALLLCLLPSMVLLITVPLFLLILAVCFIGAGIAVDFPIFHHQQLVGHLINQVPIVGNKQQGSFEGFQCCFHRFHGRNVQVIGGFIQNQQIKALQQDFCQGYLYFFTATE